MSLQLAPRPANEERRVQAVHRTGVIDSGQNTHFSVFCEIAKEVTGFEYIAFSLFESYDWIWCLGGLKVGGVSG